MSRSRTLGAPLLALLLAGCASFHEPTPLDRDVTVTADDFADWLEPHGFETVEEELTKRGFQGLFELAYHYRGEAGPLTAYVASTAYFARSPAEAEHAYRSLAFGTFRGLKELNKVPVETEIEWGEHSESYLLQRSDGALVGNLFLARRGSIAVMVVLTGTYSSDPAMFEARLEPELWKLSSHDAAAGGDG